MPNARVAAAASGLPSITFILPATRRRIEDAIELLIACLDALGADLDLEPDNDLEPDQDAEQTAAEGLGKGFPFSRFGEDEEDGGEMEEGDADREHTLGWSEAESLRGQLTSVNRETQEEFA